MSDLDILYQQMILDHSRHPRHQVGNHDTEGWMQHRCLNPLCGDSVEVFVDCVDGQISKVLIDAKGCAISVATASLMAERLQGVSVIEARELFGGFQAMLKDEVIQVSQSKSAGEQGLGKLSVLEGVNRFPMRVKCATCAWHALIAALDGSKASSVKTEV